MHRLNIQVNSLYHDMIKLASNIKTPSKFYCPKRLEKIGNRHCEKTYEGYDSCGLMTYSLYALIKKNEFGNITNMKVFNTQLGQDDHVFLFIDNHIIVDPTYRQFLNYPDQDEEFYNFLFEENKPIFVGTYHTLNNLTYNSMCISNDHSIDWLSSSKYWLNKRKDITQQYEDFYKESGTSELGELEELNKLDRLD